MGWHDLATGRRVLEGIRLADAGDARVPHDLALSEVDDRIGALVAEVLAGGAFPVTIGGEHAVTRPAIQAAAQAAGRPVTLVLFDAHTDRGSSHFGATYPRDAFVDGIVADGSADLVIEPGVRDLAHPSHGRAPDWLRTVPPAQARALGPAGLAALVPGDSPLYVSFDVDALDPAVAPGTSTPLPGGFGLWESLAFLEALAAHPRVVGLDVTELDPSLDVGDMTALAAVRLVVAFLAVVFAGRSPSPP